MKLRLLIGAALLLLPATASWADTIVWGNNATIGNVTLEAFDLTTGGNLVHQFLAPDPTALADNGRGIAVAADGTIYYTTANSGNVYKTNVNGDNLGVAFNTGLNGIATITFDGNNLFLAGYNGTNNAYEYTTSGTLLNTIVGFGNSRDGFEVITRNGQTEIIANRGDAEDPYDLYDINGNLIQSAFITTNFSGTGITYDGSTFYVSDIFNNAIAEYDNNGNFIQEVTLGGPQPPTSNGRLLEDLSVVGNTVSNGGGGTVPEPSSVAIIVGFGIVGLVGLRRRAKV